MYDKMIRLDDKMLTVSKAGKWGLIDKNNTVIASCVYQEAMTFRNGFASVQKDGKFGFINLEGKEVVPCIYDGIQKYFNEEGEAVVSKIIEKKYHYITINTKGTCVRNCEH